MGVVFRRVMWPILCARRVKYTQSVSHYFVICNGLLYLDGFGLEIGTYVQGGNL